jgi:hypothetical protein
MKMDAFFTKLPNRGLIQIEGKDRKSFLQALITNDVNKLAPGKILYACLLNAQGKFLHDMFIHETPDALLIDCEGGKRAQDLYKRLSMYRLRADVQISIEENHPVYAIVSHQNLRISESQKSAYHSEILKFGDSEILKDPRHPNMGYRSFEKPENLPEAPFETWDLHRIKLTIPDGSRDLIPDKSTMDEARMDQLNAIDYDKGCYVGQELTARMHYRGLGKKHLYTIKTSNYPDADLRSTCGDYAIALLRDEDIKNHA